jgi:hypothetical protein
MSAYRHRVDSVALYHQAEIQPHYTRGYVTE